MSILRVISIIGWVLWVKKLFDHSTFCKALMQQPGLVHLWTFSFHDIQDSYKTLIKCLSKNDQARKKSYIDDNKGVRFALARGVLRNVLAHYLGVEAAEIKLEVNNHGKPGLLLSKSLSSMPDIRFSLSRSGDYLLVGVTLHRAIGVDIEYTRTTLDINAIIRHFFLPQEIEFLQGLDENFKQEMFYRLWARKEALIKADGRGLSLITATMPLCQSTLPGHSLLEIQGQLFRYCDLYISASYQAALAIEGEELTIKRVKAPLFH